MGKFDSFFSEITTACNGDPTAAFGPENLNGMRLMRREDPEMLDMLLSLLEPAGVDVDRLDDELQNDAGHLPPGFELRSSGIWRQEDEDEWKWLCSPLRVAALPRDESGANWGRLVEITDPDGRVHRWAMPARLFAGDGSELRAGLLQYGLQLASGSKARAALFDLLMQWRPPARALSTERLGWADGCRAFVLGDGSTIGGHDVVHQAETIAGMAAEMHVRGALDEWRETVAAPSVGNPVLTTSLCVAFAGPLLEPLQLEGGGFHLRGESSRGKSTAQRAAVSVWGSPHYLQTWRATSNGLEGAAQAANGSLLALDEIGEVSGKEAGQIAYMLANGKGKSRADRTGAARRLATWRLLFLSSGEMSLADKMAEANQKVKAGQTVRLLDLPADGRTYGAFDNLHDHATGAAFADAINRAAAQNYGTAGRTFVEAFMAEGPDATRDAIQHFEDVATDRLKLTGADGQVLRAIRRFALIAAAGEAATRYGLTGWPEGEATIAALTMAQLWISTRGSITATEAREAIERVRSFITRHGDSRFQLVGECLADGSHIRDRAGWRDGDHYWISTDAWRSEVHAGTDHARAARYLNQAGHLETDPGSRLTKRTSRAVPGRPRAYCIKADILGAE